MIVPVGIALTIFISCTVYKRLAVKNAMFRLGYILYTHTYLGYLFHLNQLFKCRQNQRPHSKVVVKDFGGAKVMPIAILYDNYGYLLIDTVNGIAAVIDPSDPVAVKAALLSEKVRLEAILTTHKHWDHSGGNYQVKEEFPAAKVYGSATDAVAGMTHAVSDGDVIQVGSLRIRVLETPGHTTGHVAYILDGAPYGAPDSLFSGDLLFLGGSGRIFEGTPTVMLESLHKVANLNENTFLWPGHEYARKNLLFAATIEPRNSHLQTKLDWVVNMRKNKTSSSPSTIGEEKQYNPFLRTHVADVISATGMDAPMEQNERAHAANVLGILRELKDNFK